MDLLTYAPQALLWLSGLVVVAVGGFLTFVYWDQRSRTDLDR
jgi:hypothetical protein